MKKTKAIICIVIVLYLIVIYAINANKKCEYSNCNNKSIENGKYCIEHTCEWEGCTSEKGVGKTHYCYYHVEQNALQYQEENKIKLTESEIIQVRKVADDYLKQLMEKQSNILAVNIINDNPETTTLYIKYSCNVVREDSDTNLATLYIYITSDGVFKVDKLEYDK